MAITPPPHRVTPFSYRQGNPFSNKKCLCPRDRSPPPVHHLRNLYDREPFNEPGGGVTAFPIVRASHRAGIGDGDPLPLRQYHNPYGAGRRED